MPSIARLYDLQPAAPVLSGQLDDEFNQLVEAVNARAEKDGSLQADLNADMLDGFHASEVGGDGTIPVCNGDVQVGLNAAFLGGLAASDFAEAAFDAGTALIFYQPDAPSGWTAVSRPSTDRVLGWASGSVAGGGMNQTSAPRGSDPSPGATNWSMLGSGMTVTVDSHVLSLAEIPAHSHSIDLFGSGGSLAGVSGDADALVDLANPVTSTAGGGGGHSHTGSGDLSGNARPPIAWTIICTKD